MKDYYNIFVDLCLQTCTQHDYRSTAKVLKHNRAMTKIIEITKEIDDTGNSAVFEELLNHEDERVRLNAAYDCLRTNISVRKACKELKRLAKKSKDASISFSAKMTLEQKRSIMLGDKKAGK